MKLLILSLLMGVSVNSYARCSKGYSTVEKAEKAVAAYFNMEDLSWCKDLDVGTKGVYAQNKMLKECKVGEDAVVVKVCLMKIHAGMCALDSGVEGEAGIAAVVDGYTYEYNTDIDPNIEK